MGHRGSTPRPKAISCLEIQILSAPVQVDVALAVCDLSQPGGEIAAPLSADRTGAELFFLPGAEDGNVTNELEFQCRPEPEHSFNHFAQQE